MAERKYTTFWSFYPYYLTEHSSPRNRTLHFIGTGLVIMLFIIGLATWHPILFIFIPIAGYGFAWVGHFFVEKNRPATFTYPLYSLGSDFVMFWHILTGQIEEKVKAAERTVRGYV
jgi:hypothetical protein